MDDDDRRVLHEILGRGEGFGHRQHLELAWRYLAMHSPEQAADAMAGAIRQAATAHGQPGKFHETITRSWARCVAVHRERWPASTFPEFLDRNPQLLDSGLLGHFYSPELLDSPQARARWIEPDRRPLPAQHPPMTSAHEVVAAYWAAAEARDWAAFGALVTDDVLYRGPQAREQVRGREACLRFNAEGFDREWHLTVQRIVGEGDHAASWIEMNDGGETYPGVCFFDLADDGRIARITDFWPAPADLPASRSHLVERY